jgi:hypothetical protein
MIKGNILTILLINQYERFCFRGRSALLRDKFHVIAHSDNFASRMALDVLFLNASALIVEKPVRVSAPSHTSHVHSIEFELVLKV